MAQARGLQQRLQIHGGEHQREKNWKTKQVKQTPEKLAETKRKIYKPERVVRGLTPGSTVSGLLRVNPALRDTTRHQHNLDHAHADKHVQPPTPTLQAILFYFGTSLPQ